MSHCGNYTHIIHIRVNNVYYSVSDYANGFRTSGRHAERVGSGAPACADGLCRPRPALLAYNQRLKTSAYDCRDLSVRTLQIMMQLRHTYDIHNINTRHLRTSQSRRPTQVVRTGDVDQHVSPTAFTTMNERKAGYTYYPTPYTQYTIPQLEGIVNHLRSNGNYKGAHLWDTYKYIVVRYTLQFASRYRQRISIQFVPPEPSAMDYADGFACRVKSSEFQQVNV